MLSKTKIFIILAAWLGCAADSFAQHELDSLGIDVEILDNGDAIITEIRKAEVGDEGTEFYVVVGNLRDSDIKDLNVSDETGRQYVNEEIWDINRSRSQKEGRCGVVTKENGYELCWGLGPEGEHVYTTTYTVTNLVKSYNDFDGFNYMFVSRNMNPVPKEASVTIHPKGTLWRQEDVRMWAFGFDGEVNYDCGNVVAHSFGSLDGNPMIIMLQLNKDLFHPAINYEESFETVKQAAFEGSDYPEEEPKGFLEMIKEEPSILLVIAMFFLPFILWIVKWFSIRKLRKMANKDLLWYRDLPYNGNLQKANAVMNAMKYGKNDFTNLVSASAVRLISIGALRIEEHYVPPTGFAKIIGREGKNMRLIVIGELKEQRNLPITRMLQMLYDLFKDASGTDRILQPNEFKRFVKSNTSRLKEFMEEVQKHKMSVKQCKNDLDNVRTVLGLKKFLKEFTLANERGVQEVALWGDYLVYAELFGCADQLRKEMMQINPEFLKMDDMYKALFDDELVHQVTNLAILSAVSGNTAIQASRSGGGGGFSSIGGGGGFSGGGSGGGIR